jgi:CheY-like chemotaxis protein
VVYIPDARPELDSSKLPVLVVEDNREALFVYEKYLKGSIFQAVPARNLREARTALRRIKPVAVLLDVLLEGEQSWDLLQELKSDPGTKSVPVFVVTVVDNQAKALAMGADAFHEKPIDRKWLLHQLERTGRDPAKLRILIVDDDEASRYVVRTALGDGAFRFVEASSGNEGFRLAHEVHPDLIVLDLVMADISGFDVLSKLKDDPETSNIPVVIHTSRTLEKDDRELLAPAVGVIVKQGQSRQTIRARFAEVITLAGLPVPDLSVSQS